jgi:hypothetical protein
MIDGRPLSVSYGLGVNSTALLVGLAQRRIRPDLILFADTGAEKDSTYEYLPIVNSYLESQGFPAVTVVRYAPSKFKHWPPYRTLEENCLTNGTLPSISFGFSACSQKWKQVPQHRYIRQWKPAQDAWTEGRKVLKAIGYDCSARDRQRRTYAEKFHEDPQYDYIYHLQLWGWDRDRCAKEIAAAGLPAPDKSSCFFCLAMKPDEVRALPADKLCRIVLMEARAKPRLDKVEGLWRASTKAKPGSMTKFIEDEGLLPKSEIERIRQVPAQLVAFQQAYADGADPVPLGVFLNREFPAMYPAGVTVVEVPFEQCSFAFESEAA